MDAQAKITDSKPNVNIGMLGHEGHGKTLLTAAITQVLAKRGGAERCSYEALQAVGQRIERGIFLSTTQVEYQTVNRRYAHVDHPGHADCVKNLMTGAASLDGAILVVSAVDGPMPQTREYALLAHQSGVERLVVFLNKTDLMSNRELHELWEEEIRELLTECGFRGDEVPIIRGSARRAFEGDAGEWGERAILSLLEAVDHEIPTPWRAGDEPLLLSVEDVYLRLDGGAVVVGRVERGRLHPEEEVEVVGVRPTRRAVVTRLEKSLQAVPEAGRGDTLDVHLGGLGGWLPERGQVLATPGSLKPYTRFKAQVYLLAREDGGRRGLLLSGDRLGFNFHGVDVIGKMWLPRGERFGTPGDNLPLEIQLETPVALEKGLRFSVRETGCTVGVGIVTDVLR
ncbi:elongation factor Tu [Myxococcus fulvus 124B02]|nr:elongation factor Tu [Myxococcus fulvus 124B02]